VEKSRGRGKNFRQMSPTLEYRVSKKGTGNAVGPLIGSRPREEGVGLQGDGRVRTQKEFTAYMKLGAEENG